MDKIKERFMKKVKVVESGCWEWQGSRTRDGYGRSYYKGKQIGSHRLSVILFSNGIPLDTPIVCHKCDNPCCCNPDHLFTGTTQDNVQDAFNKGRREYYKFKVRNQVGEANNFAKLTDDIVRTIRIMKGTHQYIADYFNISRQLVGLILQGKRWSHVV